MTQVRQSSLIDGLGFRKEFDSFQDYGTLPGGVKRFTQKNPGDVLKITGLSCDLLSSVWGARSSDLQSASKQIGTAATVFEITKIPSAMMDALLALFDGKKSLAERVDSVCGGVDAVVKTNKVANVLFGAAKQQWDVVSSAAGLYRCGFGIAKDIKQLSDNQDLAKRLSSDEASSYLRINEAKAAVNAASFARIASIVTSIARGVLSVSTLVVAGIVAAGGAFALPAQITTAALVVSYIGILFGQVAKERSMSMIAAIPQSS